MSNPFEGNTEMTWYHLMSNNQLQIDHEAFAQEEAERKATQENEEYYCAICRCMMPISHFPH